MFSLLKLKIHGKQKLMQMPICFSSLPSILKASFPKPYRRTHFQTAYWGHFNNSLKTQAKQSISILPGTFHSVTVTLYKRTNMICALVIEVMVKFFTFMKSKEKKWAPKQPLKSHTSLAAPHCHSKASLLKRHWYVHHVCFRSKKIKKINLFFWN